MLDINIHIDVGIGGYAYLIFDKGLPKRAE
jgi:hypothetical protein